MDRKRVVVSFISRIVSSVRTIRSSMIKGRAHIPGYGTADEDQDSIGRDAALESRRAHNSRSPLVALPPEILIKILKYLVAIWPSLPRQRAFLPLSPHKTSLGWVVLSHTCFRIRSILLNDRQVWSSNISQIPIRPEDIYARCGDLPLTLELRPTSTEANIIFALNHLTNAGTIDFEFSRHQLAGPSSRIRAVIFSGSEFPHLRSLKLYLDTIDDSSAWLLLGSDLDVSTILAPSLRSVELVNAMVPFQPEIITSLTLHRTQRELLPSHWFLSLLGRCALLERLVASNCMTPLSANDRGTRARTVVPRLKHIELSDLADRCLELLCSLSAPILMRTELNIADIETPGPGSPSHLTTMMPYLQTATQDVTGFSLYDISKSDSNREQAVVGLILYVWEPGSPDFASRAYAGPFTKDHRSKFLMFFECVDITPPKFLDSVNTLSSFLDFSKITTLQLGSTHAYTPAAWSTALESFYNLRTLFLQGAQHTWALRSLIAPNAAQNRGRAVILPALETLWLSELSVHDDRCQEVNLDVVEEDAFINAAHLFEIFTSRTRCGSAIQSVYIDRLFMDSCLLAMRHAFLSHLITLVPTIECTMMDVGERLEYNPFTQEYFRNLNPTLSFEPAGIPIVFESIAG